MLNWNFWLNHRIERISVSLWNTTVVLTQVYRHLLSIAEKQFAPVYDENKSICEAVKRLEDKLEKAGRPIHLEDYLNGNVNK